jgi:hypothetical protein
MHVRNIVIVAGAALSICSGLSFADDAKDAKTFLAGLFATYRDNKKPPAGAHHVYDSQLQALMDEDVRLAHGEVPALDFDPLCQCQDYQHLTARLTVRSFSPNAAVIAATLRDLGIPKEKPRDAVFELVKERGAWRIHDIHADDPKSLRAFLIQQNTERAKPSKHK